MVLVPVPSERGAVAAEETEAAMMVEVLEEEVVVVEAVVVEVLEVVVALGLESHTHEPCSQ